jgi:hypothetical protein
MALYTCLTGEQLSTSMTSQPKKVWLTNPKYLFYIAVPSTIPIYGKMTYK